MILRKGRVGRRDVGNGDQGVIRRLLGRMTDLLPDGGIGHDSPRPDIDGKRDMDTEYARAVLQTKSLLTPGGQATSYEPVDRDSLHG